jgi:O-antigen/teichoic acid export membrane protein
MSELAVRTTRGLLWSAAESLSLQATQFVVSVFLARMLQPEQFGVIGMLSLFMALAQVTLDSGFGSALVQKPEIDRIDTSSVFYFNMVAALVLAIALWLAAPWISAFFSEPLLVPLTRVLTLNIVLNAFSLVPTTMLTKRMEFRSLFQINLAAVTCSGVVAIVGAMNGLGVWSLACQSVFGSLLRALLVWRKGHWQPCFCFSFQALKEMFPFGSRLMLSGIVNTFFQHINTVIIGRTYSASDLGYYVRAQSMQSMVVQPIGSSIDRVMFPALSPLQNDMKRLKAVCQKAAIIAMFLHFPLMIGLIICAAPLVELVMTRTWLPSTHYFQLLCIAVLLWPLQILNLNTLKVTGRSDVFFRLEVLKKVMLATAILCTYRWGISALLLGQIVVSFAAYYLNGFYAGRLISYPIAEQVQTVLPYLGMSLLMGVGMYVAGAGTDALVPKIIVQVVTGVVLYLGLNLIFERTALSELVHLGGSVVQSPLPSK